MSDSPAGKRPWFRFRGLKAQLVLWMILPLSLVLIGVAFTGVYSHEQAMRKLVAERDQALAVVSAGQVRDRLEARVLALEDLASEQAFRRQDPAGQRALLAQAGDMDGLLVEGTVLLDEAGRPTIGETGAPAWMLDAGPLQDLASTVMARQAAALGPILDTPQAGPALLVGVPVVDETGNPYGILAGAASLESLGLSSLLSRVQVGEHGVVYLVDASGQILAHSASGHARTSLAGHTGIPTALEDSAPGTTLCHAPDGEPMTLAYAPLQVGGLDWRLIVEQPWHEVIGPVLRYSQLMPLVAALAVVVSVLALYYGVRAIVRPLQLLGEKAERVAWGDFDATSTPVGGVEEIEDLRRTLDQMAKRIQSYQRGMHDYIAAITQGQEEERKRLARELHDDTAQALIALRLQVEMAQKLLLTAPDRAAERLDRVRALLADTVEGVRRFSRDLRPIYLEDLGLIPALEMLARQADQQENLSVQFTATGPARRLPADLELAVYRIAQEALNNVVQHARARHAWVQVQFEAESLTLKVRDDGQGFEAPDLPDTLARQGHFGLMGIQERALLNGGQLTIHSAPGQGTEIILHLPYPASI